MNLYSNLHKKYPVSRTLRFELKPIGKTKENIEKNGILKEDEERAITYKNVKKYCDEYHKYFIEKCLNKCILSEEVLNQYYNLYKINLKTEKENKEFDKIQEQMRKEISDCFKKDKQYKGLFEKDMIKEYLQSYFKEDLEKIKEISEFDRFTTYFRGFNENRKNMYTDAKESTAIAYRIIDENLPIFINNIKIFKVIQEIMKNEITKVEKELEVQDVNKIFTLEYFNKTLNQKGIEKYNLVVSGMSEKSGNKIKGINEYINEYNQKNKNKKIPKMQKLYKQILNDEEGTSFKLDKIDTDKELVDSIRNYYKILNLKNLVQLMSNIDTFNLDKIFINNDTNLTRISKDVFDDWNKINQLLEKEYDNNHNGKRTAKYEENRKKAIKGIRVFSLKYMNDLTNNNDIIEYFKNYIQNNKIIENIDKKYSDAKEILNDEYKEYDRNLIKNEKAIEKIKRLLDEIKTLQDFVKLLIPKENAIEKDSNFYSALEEDYNNLSEIIPLYNKTRNYLTQKPFSTEKFKLNFQIPTLLDGWDLNKETSNLGVILRKDEKYFLGIMNAKKRNVFTNIEEDKENYYEKMEYKLLPGPNKMLPKVFFAKSRIEEFKPSNELIEKYKKGYHKKTGTKFDIDFCNELIDFYKESINKHEDWKKFKFVFKDTKEYENISHFYNEVEQQGYKINFKNCSEKYINSLVEKGDLYLFQIYNKDFSPYSKGKQNLHTMYWKALFDEENLKNIVYKLNGQAEVFYRKASLDINETTIHRKNEPIKNKNKNAQKKESTFKYDLIKNKRYTVDKFQFHVPIEMNFINSRNEYLNEEVNKYLRNNDVNVIGIDRGERNLLYITVVNPQGEILEQYSLNEIINEYNKTKYVTNYHDLLDIKEKEREKARESWKTIENIKELKEGYLSQVIHKIVTLMDKYKAIIVIEDLNSGFKNSRIKVEKQVYQKFEKMLIDKLNYLVFKDRDKLDEGGLLNAYQLTNKFESFAKMGRQTGVLFYIPAWCTSKIDPTTGFVNLLNTKYESIEKAKEFFCKIEDIRFNKDEGYFEFDIDYSNFTNRPYGIRKKWTICTYGKRIQNFRNPDKNNNWDSIELDISKEFEKLFKKYKVDFDRIKEDILSQESKEFWQKILQLLKLALQMRNSIPNTSKDYIISPIKNSKGVFYDSNSENKKLPIDADANGAYNIARKGLMIIEQIRNTEEEKLRKIKFKISNQDWLTYVQERNK